MNRYVAILVGLVLALIASVSGLVLWRTDDGRSAVGVYQRTDGSIHVVTAWCAGERIEKPTVARWQDGATGEILSQAEGLTDGSATIFTIGSQNPDLTIQVSEALPADEWLIAYNAAAPQSWFPRQGYPSAATIFRTPDLPVSDAPFPEQVAVGNGQTISGQALVATRCNPQFHHVSTR